MVGASTAPVHGLFNPSNNTAAVRSFLEMLKSVSKEFGLMCLDVTL